MSLLISLGSNCYVSWTLRKVGFQKASYPIDWVNSFRFAKLLDFIQSYRPELLHEMQASPIKVDQGITNRYFLPEFEIRLPHEHDVEPDITFEEIAEKYRRRFERFRRDIEIADHVIFLRCVAHRCYDQQPELAASYTRDLLERAVDVLGQACGHKRFTLLLISEVEGLPRQPADHVVRARLNLPFENVFYSLRPNLPTMKEAEEAFRLSIARIAATKNFVEVGENLSGPFESELLIAAAGERA